MTNDTIPTPAATPPDILRCAYMEIVVTDLAASRDFPAQWDPKLGIHVT